MGIFKWTESERERVEALWGLTALPRGVVDATYGVMLERYWRCIAAPDGNDWSPLRREALSCAVAALNSTRDQGVPRLAVRCRPLILSTIPF